MRPSLYSLTLVVRLQHQGLVVVRVLYMSITLFLALSFVGEVVVHGDTKTHGDSQIFDLRWLFYFEGRNTMFVYDV